jgi:hypothetical protein
MALYVNYLFQSPGAGKGPPAYLTGPERLRLFESNAYHALATVDEYVWCYGERLSWWEDGYPVPTPKGALDALRSARAKYAQGRPLGFDLTERVAAARAKEREQVRPKEPGGKQP